MPLTNLRERFVAIATLGMFLGACTDSAPPVPGPVTHAAFATQPVASVPSAQSLGTVRVLLQDEEGRVSRSDATVTIELMSVDPAAQLSGSTVANAVDGVATFSDLSVAKAGTGYKLVAKVSGIDDVMSDAFDVVPGPAAQLRFQQNSISASVYPRCVPDALPFTVWVTDAAGNVVPTATPAVTLSLARTGAFGITLSTDDNVYGTATRTAVAGVAQFDDLSVHKSGTYGITASASGLTAASMSGFVGGCYTNRLVFVTQPADAAAGVAIGTFSVLEVDAYGNALSEQHSPGPSYSVTISFGNNPSGAALAGTVSVFGAGTSARDFNTVSIDKPGTGYTLVATSSHSATPPVTSAAFSIR